MAGFDGLSPYMKVAAGQLIESPEVMRLTRDLVAMRREGRQNMFASIISGGKYGGVGRVTEANLMGPDTGRISALEAERAEILRNAMKQRLEGSKSLAAMAQSGDKLAIAYLNGEAGVAAAKAAANASIYNANSQRLRDLEKNQADLVKATGQSDIVGILRSAAGPEAEGGASVLQTGYRALMKIPAGSFEIKEFEGTLKEYLGPKAGTTPAEKAAFRVMLGEKGITTDTLDRIGLPLSGQEATVFNAQFENAAATLQYQVKNAELIDEVDEALKRSPKGASSQGDLFAKAGGDLSRTQAIAKHLETLGGLTEEERKALTEATTDPLIPAAKERMKEIDDALGQLKSVAGGTLKKEATLYLRQYPAVPDLVKNAVSSAFEAKLTAAGTDEEKRAKIMEQRDNMLASVDKLGETGRGGRRIERALIGEQKALQRGVRNAAEVNAETGDVARTRARDLVVSEESRKQQKAAITAGAIAGREDLADPAEVQEALGTADDAKSMIGDLGVGQGNRPVYERPSKAPKAAAPKAPVGDEDEAEADEEEPESDATAMWKGILQNKNPFARGATQRDLVANRLAAIKGKALT